MANKRPKPEEIVTKLRQVEVLTGQGMPRFDGTRRIGVTGQTYYRWSAGGQEKAPVGRFPLGGSLSKHTFIKTHLRVSK